MTDGRSLVDYVTLMAAVGAGICIVTGIVAAALTAAGYGTPDYRCPSGVTVDRAPACPGITDLGTPLLSLETAVTALPVGMVLFIIFTLTSGVMPRRFRRPRRPRSPHRASAR